MMALVFSSCQNKSQNMDGQAQVSEFKLKPNLEIIQFHSEHRCQTCMDIEAMTKEAILPYRGIPFRLINDRFCFHERIRQRKIYKRIAKRN